MNFDDEPKTLAEQYAIEKAQLEIDIAARAEQIERMQRENAANAYRQEQHRADTATKSYDYSPPRRRSAPIAAPAQLTESWRDYIERQLDRRERIMLKALAPVLVEQEKMLRAQFKAELEAEVAKLRNEFLQDRLDAERGIKRLRPVSDKIA